MQQNKYSLAPACLLTGMLLITPTSVLSEVYKWVDQQGRTHYGEKPPAKTTSEQMHLNPSSSPSVDNISPQEHKNRQRKLLRAYEEERLQREDNRLKAKQDSERRKRQCSTARNRLRIVGSGRRIYDLDKQGNRVYLDSKALDKARAAAARDVRRLCR